MREAIAEHRQFSEHMRAEYFEIVIPPIAELRKEHEKLVIGQALFKNRNRKQIQIHFREIKFVWVQAEAALLVKRLAARRDHPADQAYGELVNKQFEIPNITYDALMNNHGKQEVIEQIAKLPEKQKQFNSAAWVDRGT